MSVRVIQGTAAGRRRTPLEDAYDQFRLERQGNRLSPRTLAAYDYHAFSRRIVGWRVSTSLRAELALDALEMASWPPPSGWIGGTSVGFTAPSTTCRRPSTSVGGGSWRKARLPDVALRPAPPSRRLGGELTSADTAHRRRCSGVLRVAVIAAQRHPLSSLYRFLYHRKGEATAGPRIQAAKSPENPGRFRVPLRD